MIMADTYNCVTKLQMSFLVLLIIYVKWGEYSGKKTVTVRCVEKTFMKLQ